MPIEPSALPVGVGLASATAGADIVMPTTSQRTFDATSAFAEILGSSLSSATELAGTSTSTSALPRSPQLATQEVAPSQLLGATHKTAKSGEASNSSAVSSTSTASSSSSAIFDPTTVIAFPAAPEARVDFEPRATELSPMSDEESASAQSTEIGDRPAQAFAPIVDEPPISNAAVAPGNSIVSWTPAGATSVNSSTDASLSDTSSTSAITLSTQPSVEAGAPSTSGPPSRTPSSIWSSHSAPEMQAHDETEITLASEASIPATDAKHLYTASSPATSAALPVTLSVSQGQEDVIVPSAQLVPTDSRSRNRDLANVTAAFSAAPLPEPIVGKQFTASSIEAPAEVGSTSSLTLSVPTATTADAMGTSSSADTAAGVQTAIAQSPDSRDHFIGEEGRNSQGRQVRGSTLPESNPQNYSATIAMPASSRPGGTDSGFQFSQIYSTPTAPNARAARPSIADSNLDVPNVSHSENSVNSHSQSDATAQSPTAAATNSESMANSGMFAAPMRTAPLSDTAGPTVKAADATVGLASESISATLDSSTVSRQSTQNATAKSGFDFSQDSSLPGSVANLQLPPLEIRTVHLSHSGQVSSSPTDEQAAVGNSHPEVGGDTATPAETHTREHQATSPTLSIAESNVASTVVKTTALGTSSPNSGPREQISSRADSTLVLSSVDSQASHPGTQGMSTAAHSAATSGEASLVTAKQAPSQDSNPPNFDLDDLMSPQDLAVSAAPSQRSNLSQADNAGPRSVALPDSDDTAGATAQTTASNAQAQSDSHTSRQGDYTADASAMPASAASSTSDSAVASQGSSIAAGVTKVELGAAGLSGAPATPANDQPSAPLPIAALARNSAENVELSSGLQAWNGGDNAQTRLVQSANLAGNLHTSEMNVALQAEALGPVELRTRITGDSVGASIGVERHDAHALIASELPALHQALNDRQLRVADLSVFQGSIHSGIASGNGQASQQRDTGSPRAARQEWAAESNSPLPDFSTATESGDAATLFDSNGRLSVRA